MRPRLLPALALVLALAGVGDGGARVHAATCTPSGKGTCQACKNCRYCGNCAKHGGTCSVCKRSHSAGPAAHADRQE